MGISLGLGFVCLLAMGCQSKIHDENEALWRQNRELQAKLNDASAQAKPTGDSAQLAALQQQVSDRDAKIKQLQDQLRQPAPAAAPEPALAGIQTSYDKSSGKVTVSVPGDVLFAPGDATVRPQAKSTLDKLALSLEKDYAGKHVRIDGHTDSDPIHYSKWKSNLQLSQARAVAVKEYLVKRGVNPAIITTHGYGAERPKGHNKAENRRVEIVVATRS
jgi:flagellar motor protein MotB